MSAIEKMCGGCRWFTRRQTQEIGATQGECRRMPPNVSAIPQGAGAIGYITAYPVINKVFPGCGEFADKLEIVSGT